MERRDRSARRSKDRRSPSRSRNHSSSHHHSGRHTHHERHSRRPDYGDNRENDYYRDHYQSRPSQSSHRDDYRHRRSYDNDARDHSVDSSRYSPNGSRHYSPSISVPKSSQTSPSLNPQKSLFSFKPNITKSKNMFETLLNKKSSTSSIFTNQSNNKSIKLFDSLSSEKQETSPIQKDTEVALSSTQVDTPVKDTKDDIDPLDAYMLENNAQIDTQMNEEPSLDIHVSASTQPDLTHANVITFEDIIKDVSKTDNEVKQTEVANDDSNDENQEDKYLEEFKEALKKKQEEDEQKRILLEKEQKQEATIISGDVEKEEYIYEDGDISPSEPSVLDLYQKKLQKKQLAPVDHSKIDYIPIKKDFFILPSAVKAMSEAEIESKRQEWNMKVKGKDCPPPIFSWIQTYLNDRILYTIKKNNYENPFPIQSQAIPAILTGRDVIAVARTGSGKTLGYLLPMFKHIMMQTPLSEGEGPIAIIMAPARELVAQIYKECSKFLSILNMRAVAVFGGSSVSEQINGLRRGCDIVVCTPGRMIDLLCMNGGRLISLSRISFVVLDEADRMLDMGFEPQISMILNNIRPDRQTVMFSATFPVHVERLALAMLKKPIVIMIGGRAEVAGEVDQHVEVIVKEKKFFRLLQILGEWSGKGSILIFVDKQDSCDQLFGALYKNGHYALTLHGGMEQEDRDQSIVDFKNKLRPIMIATSVAGRGLDIKGLVLVINYDCPNHLEDYVHRVGRTGRAGELGTAYTFITPEEQMYAGDLVKALTNSTLEVPKELQELADDYEMKIKAGEARRHINGYMTKGFTFSEQETLKNEFLKNQQKRLEDLNTGVISEEIATDEQKQEEAVLAKLHVKVDKQASLMDSESGLLRPDLQPAVYNPVKNNLSIADSTNRALQAIKTIEEHKDVNDIISKVQKVMEESNLSCKNQQEMIRQVVNNKIIYLWKVEINDYPVKARGKIMSKTELNRIMEDTNTSLTCRGVYVAKNKRPSLGEEKLYIAVEGDTPNAVIAGRDEVKRVLEEITKEVGIDDHPSVGHYTVA